METFGQVVGGVRRPAPSADDGWIAVLGTDLKAGEPVIVVGAYNLPDGTEVTTSR